MCGGGIQIRERECVNPLHGGQQCLGSSNETRPCNEHPCPGKYNSKKAFLTLLHN